MGDALSVPFIVSWFPKKNRSLNLFLEVQTLFALPMSKGISHVENALSSYVLVLDFVL